MLLGIPMLFLMTSVISMGINGWQLQSLVYATEMTARYVSVHGATCAQNGNSCTINRGQVATYFAGQGIALNAGLVNVSLTDSSGTTTCNPVNGCNNSTTQFPASTANSVGSDITIQATYAVSNPMAMFWGNSRTVNAQSYTLGAKSRQRIQF